LREEKGVVAVGLALKVANNQKLTASIRASNLKQWLALKARDPLVATKALRTVEELLDESGGVPENLEVGREARESAKKEAKGLNERISAAQEQLDRANAALQQVLDSPDEAMHFEHRRVTAQHEQLFDRYVEDLGNKGAERGDFARLDMRPTDLYSAFLSTKDISQEAMNRLKEHFIDFENVRMLPDIFAGPN
jgi:hypothetical protein